jgi:hypothetical protein
VIELFLELFCAVFILWFWGERKILHRRNDIFMTMR